MGKRQSKFTNEADTIEQLTVFCERHASKKATGFCLPHKQTICMSCIVQKLHCDGDCYLQEIEYVDRKVLLCLKMKEKLNEYDSKLDVNVIEDKMATEIEAAYAEALDKLEEYKSASYEETKKEISILIEREKGILKQTCFKIDEAIDHYMSGNIAECEKVFKDMEDTRLITRISFEKVKPSFVAEGNSLVSVEEEIDIPEQLDWKTCCKYWSDIEPICDSDDSNDSSDVVDGAKNRQESTRDELSPDI